MPRKPFLTIGLAHFNDFAGLWPTIQSVRINNPNLLSEIQFLVVNNSPDDQATANAIRGLLASTKQHSHDWEPLYFELANNVGTSASRNELFHQAEGEFVLVMDCHLELAPGALATLFQYYRDHPDTSDLISGALINDTLQSFSTHFRDTWGGGMWGQWSQAWKCACGPQGSYFDLQSVTFESGNTLAMPRRLKLGNEPLNYCEACGKSIPEISWNQHELKYLERGFTPAGINRGEPVFEIPGQGLGLFSCRRAAWLGFNPHARAFGAEELCIHEKYRQAGHRALCLPGLIWSHRFYRPGGHSYPNTNWDKARNYVLWFQELGLNTDPIQAEFKLPPESWQALLDDPITHTTDPGPALATRAALVAQAASVLQHLSTADELYDEVAAIPRDLNEHMPTLRALASVTGIETCVELTGRRESTIALLAAGPSKLYSYTTEYDGHVARLAALVADTTILDSQPGNPNSIVADIPANDLLFLDTRHTYPQTSAELAAYAPRCRRFIAIHDTEIYGERGEDGQLGIRLAISEFCDDHPEWAVIDHTTTQYGLTILSCHLADRPETPVEGFNVPHGPGTELKKILTRLGITPAPSCGCNSKAAQMDIWGVTGCRDPENNAQIVAWLKDGTWSGLDLAGAVARAVFTGLAWHINPLHPFQSLVDLCIDAAADKAESR